MCGIDIFSLASDVYLYTLQGKGNKQIRKPNPTIQGNK